MAGTFAHFVLWILLAWLLGGRNRTFLCECDLSREVSELPPVVNDLRRIGPSTGFSTGLGSTNSKLMPVFISNCRARVFVCELLDLNRLLRFVFLSRSFSVSPLPSTDTRLYLDFVGEDAGDCDSCRTCNPGGEVFRRFPEELVLGFDSLFALRGVGADCSLPMVTYGDEAREAQLFPVEIIFSQHWKICTRRGLNVG